MKKIISLLIAVLMLINIISVCAFAENEPCETVAFKLGKHVTQESDNFLIEYEDTVHDISYGKYGTKPEDRKCRLKITAKENSGFQIKRLEIEQLPVNDLDIITMNAENIYEETDFTCIDGINNTEFLLESKTTFNTIHTIRIYYGSVQNHAASTFSENSGVIITVIGGTMIIALAVIIIIKNKHKA